jgi:hypothetical protein
MELEVEVRSRPKDKYCGVYFEVDKALLERWKAKVRQDGDSYTKVFEALMRYYLGERLTKESG